MGWSIGWDSAWQRDVGYGVPAICDYPKCNESIDRGLSYVCGSDVYGGEYGCGLYFCEKHLKPKQPQGSHRLICQCPKCYRNDHKPYKPKPDVQEWIDWKMTDSSWAQWRKENNK